MKKIFTILFVSLCMIQFGFSQDEPLKPTVIKANYFDVSPPLRDMVQKANYVGTSWKDGVVKNNHYPSEIFGNMTENQEAQPQMVQSWFGPLIPDTTIANFDGVGANNGVCPPDTDGDVGPNHYISVVNLMYSIYDKNGTKLMGPFNNSNIFSGMAHNSNDGDAIVLYDETADRWLFSQFSLPSYPNGPFYENVAISQTPDPTGSWYRYQFTFTDMPDYPKLSVWTDGYYMTTNRFSSGSTNYMGTGAVAMDRAKMLAGDPSASMIFFTLPSTNSAWAVLPSDCDGALPPMGTPCYFVYVKPNTMTFYEFHADWTTPANSTYTQSLQLPVQQFTSNVSGGIPQKGTGVKLDPMSGRLMYRLQFRKFMDHWSMVASGTVGVNGIAGLRWYELRKEGANPWYIYQQSTYSPDDNYRWMGSIAMDSSGNIAMGYSISSASMYPSIRYVGRMSSDPLNTMSIAEAGIINGGGSQTNTWSGSPSRWGDYSCLSVDPTSPMTFWYTQEYYATTSQSGWKTRVGSFSFANILSVHATAAPNVVCAGSSTQLNVNATGGSGTYTYSWTSVPAGFTSNIQNPVVTPTETTKYVATVNDGTQYRVDTVLVSYQPLPTVFAGNDTNYSNNITLFPVVGIVSNTGHVQWTTEGDGHFLNDTLDMTLYYPGNSDRSHGGVVLNLKGYAKAPCTDSVTDGIFIILGEVGLNDQAANAFGIKISPNPTKGAFMLTILNAKDQEVAISISDIKGSVVYQLTDRPNSNTFGKNIDLSTIAKGTYVVKVQSEKGVKTQRLVVE